MENINREIDDLEELLKKFEGYSNFIEKEDKENRHTPEITNTTKNHINEIENHKGKNYDKEDDTKAPVYNFLEELKIIDPDKAESIEKTIKKSVNNNKINFKPQKKFFEKSILILLIATIIGISVKIAPKIITHIQTEKIKTECLENFTNQLETEGIDLKKITIENLIYNSNPEYLKEHLFEIYLMIEDSYNYTEARNINDLLVQKAGLAQTFDEYLKNEGYHKKTYYSENAEGYYISADKAAWENAMETQLLTQKEVQNKTVRGGK